MYLTVMCTYLCICFKLQVGFGYWVHIAHAYMNVYTTQGLQGLWLNDTVLEASPFETWCLEQKLTDSRVRSAWGRIAGYSGVNQPVKPVWLVVMLCFVVWVHGFLTPNSSSHMPTPLSRRNTCTNELSQTCICTGYTCSHIMYTHTQTHNPDDIFFCLHLARC